jgi:hypothetical protein
MKKRSVILTVTMVLFMSLFISAQEAQQEEFKPSGKATGKVFWNFNYNLTEDVDQRASFAIQRAYLGYSYNFSEKFSATILLDGAKKTISDVDFDKSESKTSSEYTVFVKNAQLDYKITPKILLSGGLIGLKQVDTQKKFTGYRYMFKAFQDEFALGTTADLGVNAEFSVLENLKINAFILNGEGFTSLQDELGMLKFGGNVIYEPIDGLTLKGYYDVYGGKAEVNDSVINSDTTFIQTFDFWAGYKTEKIKLGAGYTYKINGKDYKTVAADYDQFGFYGNATYIFNDKWEVFGVWLKYKSNTLSGAENSWNYNKYDGNMITGGVQYAPVKGVKMALNYRTTMYDDPDKTTKSYIYMNFEFGF